MFWTVLLFDFNLKPAGCEVGLPTPSGFQLCSGNDMGLTNANPELNFNRVAESEAHAFLSKKLERIGYKEDEHNELDVSVFPSGFTARRRTYITPFQLTKNLLHAFPRGYDRS